MREGFFVMNKPELRKFDHYTLLQIIVTSIPSTASRKLSSLERNIILQPTCRAICDH